LTVSADVLDTDLVARMVDVGPDGKSLNIQEGALRLRYREGAVPRLLTRGEPVTVTVDMRSIAYRMSRGHRLRLHVTSSSFPRLDRNLNTGGDNSRETQPLVARVSLHHGPNAPSFLAIRVLPSGGEAN